MHPVGDRAQGGTGGELAWRTEQCHERHETAVGSAVNTDTRRIDIAVFHQPVDAVQHVFQFRVAHLSIDRRTPVTPVTG